MSILAMKDKLRLLNANKKDTSILARMGENYEKLMATESPVFNKAGSAAAGCLTILFDKHGSHQFVWTGNMPNSFLVYALEGLKHDIMNGKFNSRTAPDRIAWGNDDDS